MKFALRLAVVLLVGATGVACGAGQGSPTAPTTTAAPTPVATTPPTVAPPVVTMSYGRDTALLVGEVVPLTAIAVYADGRSEIVTSEIEELSSSDSEMIAISSNRELIGRAVGGARILGKFRGNSTSPLDVAVRMPTSTTPPPTVVPPNTVAVTNVRLSGGRFITFDIQWGDLNFPMVGGVYPDPYIYGCGRSNRQAVRYLCASYQLSARGIRGAPVLRAGAASGFSTSVQDWAVEALRQRGITTGDGIVVFISGRIGNMSGQNPVLFISEAELALAGLGGRGEADFSFNLSPLSLR